MILMRVRGGVILFWIKLSNCPRQRKIFNSFTAQKNKKQNKCHKLA